MGLSPFLAFLLFARGRFLLIGTLKTVPSISMKVISLSTIEARPWSPLTTEFSLRCECWVFSAIPDCPQCSPQMMWLNYVPHEWVYDLRNPPSFLTQLPLLVPPLPWLFHQHWTCQGLYPPACQTTALLFFFHYVCCHYEMPQPKHFIILVVASTS